MVKVASPKTRKRKQPLNSQRQGRGEFARQFTEVVEPVVTTAAIRLGTEEFALTVSVADGTWEFGEMGCDQRSDKGPDAIDAGAELGCKYCVQPQRSQVPQVPALTRSWRFPLRPAAQPSAVFYCR